MSKVRLMSDREHKAWFSVKKEQVQKFKDSQNDWKTDLHFRESDPDTAFLCISAPIPIKANIFGKGELEWPTIEHCYLASKYPHSKNWREKIRNASLEQARKFAKANDVMRRQSKEWEDSRVELIKQLSFAKFDQYPDLREKLLQMADKILLYNPKCGDKFWGVGIIGKGENMLGRLLMEVQATLLEEDANQHQPVEEVIEESAKE